MTRLLAAVSRLAIEPVLSIPHGVLLWEIYLAFSGEMPPGRWRDRPLPAGWCQFGCRLAVVECQAGEFQLQRAQPAGQGPDVRPAALPQ